MNFIKAFRERFSLRGFFTTADAKKFLAKKKAGKGYYKLLLHNLSKKGEITRATKGSYTFMKEGSGISSTITPSYHGLQEALTIHGIWGQATNQILITPRKVRSGERQVLGRKVLVRRINRKMFFGDRAVNYAGEWLNVSDIEKTLIDFYYFHEPLDRQMLRKLLAKINMEKLRAYLKMAPKITKGRVLKTLREN